MCLPLACHAAPAPDNGRAIRAAASARLAEEGGDARSALSALVEIAGSGAAVSGIDRRILEQSVIAGDLRRAGEAAQRMWLAGDQRFDARIILLVDAIKRADWRASKR
jgi:hypothetical protein